MAENTLGEWSDNDDNWIFDVNENSLWDWSDSEVDEIIRGVEENWSDFEVDEIIRDVEEQVGRGEKRKSDDDVLPEEDFYEIENVKQIKSKKFRTSATDYSIRFNNVVSELDLIESYQRTQAIFEHLLNDVTTGMNDQDQVRFVLRSTQLDTPISMPFMPVAQLTPERVFSQIERVIKTVCI